MSAHAVLERHRYEATTKVRIDTLYGFMHPFLPSTTEWTAEKPDGSVMGGAFKSKDDNLLKEDVKWTALHDPSVKRTIMVWYPKPLKGQGAKTF